MENNPEKIKIETGKLGKEKTEKEPEEEVKEEELNPEEIEELGKEMKEYTKGLLERIDKIKAELKLEIEDERAEELKVELSDLEEQLSGLGEFVSDIEKKEYEKITMKPVEEGLESEEEVLKKEGEELAEEREKIKEMPEQKEEKTIEDTTIEKLSEKHPKVPKDLLKNYIETTKKLAEMNIPTKLREEKELTSIEKLALQDWKNIKATMDLLERTGS